MNSKLNNAKFRQVDATNFESEVLKSEQSVLVAFSAPWSRPCQILEPVLDEISALQPDRLKVVQVNADENPDLGLRYGIQAVPTLLCFVAGNVRCRIVGTVTKAATLSKLELLIHPNPNVGE